MPKFSQSSMNKLRTTHVDLQTLFQVVVKFFDCTITSGLRTTAEQQALYAKGRTAPGGIVTNCDGIIRKSNHQSGNAVDVVPYFKSAPHYRWDDKESMYHFAGQVLGIAKLLKEQGLIDSDITWGGNWDNDDELHDQTFMDLVHFEIKK